MNTKYILIALAILVAAPVAWYLISPLFITKRVDEGMDELLQLAGVSAPAMPKDEPQLMDLESITPPAGEDPRMESKGPTTPPPTMPTVQGVGQGTFEGLAGHSAEGRASLIKIGDKYFVRLEDDFRVTNGPDLYVGFGKSGAYQKGAEIARLKGNEGGQNYEVPAELNPAQFNEVWIWCRAFSVPFAKAVLN